MFEDGTIIAGKYRVEGVCSDGGGMGRILFVAPLNEKVPFGIVLKYCKDSNDESLKRFRREVRLLAAFRGNARVVQILDQDLEHDPPYFVMKYYPDGDLLGIAAKLKASFEAQEHCFLQMIDCVQELHARGTFHRDIKPQNFLLDDSEIVVSDFGLTTEVGSETAFTRSSMYWGTHGYIPPEFLNGGFKHADAAGDIFMLGKTMYVLMTDREPMYVLGDGVASPLFHIIERCCSLAKANRYQTLTELRQSVIAAYDVLLGRTEGVGKVKQLLSSIQDRLEHGVGHGAAEISEFVEQLGLLDDREQIQLCSDFSRRLFLAISEAPLAGRLAEFLTIYEKLVEGRDYGWGYAETIAGNMRAVFDCVRAPLAERAKALELAIRAAEYMNRFAAMDTCRSMLTSIRDEALGARVASVLSRLRGTFISGVEPGECQSESIRVALRQIKNGGLASPSTTLD